MENSEITDSNIERPSSSNSYCEPLSCFEELNQLYEDRLTLVEQETGSDVTEVINTNFLRFIFIQ